MAGGGSAANSTNPGNARCSRSLLKASKLLRKTLLATWWGMDGMSLFTGQTSGTGEIIEDEWQGIKRVIIPVNLPGWRGHIALRLALYRTRV